MGADGQVEPTASMSQLVIEWLSGCPLWFSAAMGAIASNGRIDSETIDKLAAKACMEAEIEVPFAEAVDIPAISPEQIMSLAFEGHETIICSIEDLKNVNNIQDGTRIEFAPQGLTLVYGENGAGKTGYSRLLRNTCASRAGSSPILPNIYKANDAGPAHATFHVMIDGREINVPWVAGEGPELLFPDVFFFDGECGEVEVSKQNEISYTPPILVLLKNLSETVDNVAHRITDYREQVLGDLRKLELPEELRCTDAAREIDSRHSVEDIERALEQIKLSDEEKLRLAKIPGLLNSAPEVELPRAEARAKQLNDLRNRLAAVYSACCEEPISDRAEKLLAYKSAQEAAKAAALIASKGSVLEGIGTTAWKTMWEAARAYSNDIAYKEGVFPDSVAEGVCPLCQQPLTGQARARFLSFEEFVKGAAEKHLRERKAELSKIDDQFTTTIGNLSDAELELSAIDDPTIKASLAAIIEQVRSKGGVLPPDEKRALRAETENSGKALRSELDSANEVVKDLKKRLNPKNIQALQGEYTNLQARTWISQHGDDYIHNSNIMKKAEALKGVIGRCSTRSISALVARIAEEAIAGALIESFENEIQALGASSFHVTIATASKKGKGVQSLELVETTKRVPLESVLSEGEQKAAAIAGFLANIDLQKSKSTVVFDDPVTPLDHLWRGRIAQRLAVESGQRPVVVFTHDLPFALNVINCAEEKRLQLKALTVERANGYAGAVVEGTPWDGLSVKKRIAYLNNEVQRLESMYSESDADYKRAVAECYSLLRSAWERAVEGVLLGGVVQRYDVAVHTQTLRNVIDVSMEDVDEVNQGMTKCSKVTESHDTPVYIADPPPPPEEFSKDVEELGSWVKSIRKRREH